MRFQMPKYVAVGTACAVLGGGGIATAATTGLLDGHNIKHGSIPTNRLSPSAQRAIRHAMHPIKGATGAQGATGATGAQGQAGAKGADGPVGPAGPKGAPGPQGAAGLRGDTGPQGLTGAKGDMGPQGPRGWTGYTGAVGPQGPKGDKGDTGAPGQDGAQGSKGDVGTIGPQGPKGNDGKDGRDGSNPAVPVVNVPTIEQSSGNNPNPDSGDAGDGGWYFSGKSGGSAALTNGELELSGPGVDSKTAQGGIGIAKAFNNVPLSDLDGLTYQWHANEVNAVSKQAPTIHMTVTGLTANSKFSSGFANLAYNPTLNGVTPSDGAGYQSNGFAPNANWYSTTESNINSPGGQNTPETLGTFMSNNPHAVITQISLDNGGTSGGAGSFDAGADNLVLGFGGTNTRYDFGG